MRNCKGPIPVPCTLFNSFHIPNLRPVFISCRVLYDTAPTQYFFSLNSCSHRDFIYLAFGILDLISGAFIFLTLACACTHTHTHIHTHTHTEFNSQQGSKLLEGMCCLYTLVPLELSMILLIYFINIY